jgi:hypothetical protein
MKSPAITFTAAGLVLSLTAVASTLAGSTHTAQPVQPTQQRPAPPRDAEQKSVRGTAVPKGRVVAGETCRTARIAQADRFCAELVPGTAMTHTSGR